MFRIRRIFDDVSSVNKEIIEKVGQLIRYHFPDIPEQEVSSLGERLTNPFLKRFDTILYVAEKGRHQLAGFALLMIEPQLNFAFLDFVSTGKQLKNRGIGGALYEAVRYESAKMKLVGVFCEALPDDPLVSPSDEECSVNARRLRFYERYGARPIINTLYELPLSEEDPYMPYLLFDNTLGKPLSARKAREVVRAILERKYSYLCPEEYVEKVVRSIKQSPVALREFRYCKKAPPPPLRPSVPMSHGLTVCVNEKHDIHHVRERGYVEAPVRIPTIMKELVRVDGVEVIESRPFSERHIHAVHSSKMINYMKNIAQKSGEGSGKSFYPYVFPIRNRSKEPSDLTVRAGYFCIDTFTPINASAFHAAKEAVNATLTAAAALLDGEHFAYALVRPPGHHAERNNVGAFCYFNNNAIAAHYLSKHGTVAVLDIDYHHGNGQQQIFYRRKDVFTVSIHGHPDFAYPYFCGFESEQGKGDGRGYNRNLPQPEHLTEVEYLEVLHHALALVREYDPSFLVVACGFDTAANDPTGTWANRAREFGKMGTAIAALKKPTLFVQEGGYRTASLGVNAAAFFKGVLSI